MKLFKKIYFPIVSGLIILFLIFSFIDARGGFVSSPVPTSDVRAQIKKLSETPRYTETARNRTVQYIVEQLHAMNLRETTDILNTSGKNEASILVSGGKMNTYVIQSNVLTASERMDYYNELGITDELYTNTSIKNVVAILPANSGNVSPQTVVFTANYDSEATSVSAADNSLGVAAMLSAIKTLKDDTSTRKNNLVFVFADKGIENDIGVYTFFTKFIGFENAAANTSLIVNLARSGNRGTLTLSQSNALNNGVLSILNSNSLYTSSVAQVFGNCFASFSDYTKTLGDIVSLNLARTAGRENQGTGNDTATDLSDGNIAKQVAVVCQLADYFAHNTFTEQTAQKELVYFSYLGINIVYPVLAALILTALIVALLAAIVYFNIRLKTFDFKKTGWGIIASLCSIASAMISLFAVYCLFGLIFAGYGMFNIHYFFALNYSSVGLMIAAIIASITLTLFWSLFFKWVFGVRASDMVMGNVAISAAVALGLGFVFPKVVFGLVAFSTLQLINVLVGVLLKKKFKEKYGFDINRLFLNFVPVVLCLPLIVPSMLIAGDALGVVFYPLILGAIVLVAQSVLPYFILLDKFFNKLALKLPHVNRRVLREVQTTVPNPARKGTTKVITEKKITVEKRPISYHHSFASIVLGVVSVILILCFAIGGNAYTNFAGRAHYDAFYENALVYHLDRDNDTGYWQVKDLGLSRILRGVIEDLDWDSELGMYVKKDVTSDKNRHNEYPMVNESAALRSVTITPMDRFNSVVELDISFVGNLPQSFKVLNGSDEVILNYELRSVDRNFKLTIPAGARSFTLEFSGSVSAEIRYTEKNMEYSTLATYSEWKKVESAFKESTILAAINPHYLITRTINISY